MRRAIQNDPVEQKLGHGIVLCIDGLLRFDPIFRDDGAGLLVDPVKHH